MTGCIFQLSVSPGGVPKLPVREAVVTPLGLEGDQQTHTKIHGGPERAICLFTLELIQLLQAEGHPIWPGSAGENVTMSGIPWTALRPGLSLALGDEVRIEITRDTSPCKGIAGSFVDGRFQRLDHTRDPGITRWYARVTQPGRIRVGQTIRVG